MKKMNKPIDKQIDYQNKRSEIDKERDFFKKFIKQDREEEKNELSKTIIEYSK